jgi:hypothetical protein
MYKRLGGSQNKSGCSRKEKNLCSALARDQNPGSQSKFKFN